MNIFEKAIQKRAEIRFKQEFKKLISFIEQSDILKKLDFIYPKNDKGEVLIYRFSQRNGSWNHTDLFSSGKDEGTKGLTDITNYDTVREELIKKYQEEEETKILTDIETLRHYVNQKDEEIEQQEDF